MPIKSRSRDFTLQQAATWLGMSRLRLIGELERLQVIFHDGQFGIRPKQEAINRGLFRLEQGSTYINGSIPKHYHLTKVTVQGLAWIEQQTTQALSQAS